MGYRTGGDGGESGALPGGYEFRVSPLGALQVWQLSTPESPERMLSEQDVEGLRVAASVFAGSPSSIHSGEYGMGSGGDQMVWASSRTRVAQYPSWSSVSLDGLTKSPSKTRVAGATRSNAESAGTLAGSGSVDYNDSFTAAADVMFHYLETVPAEAYTGRLRYRADRADGSKTGDFYFDADTSDGVRINIPFDYPLWVKAGEVFVTQLTKADGTFLKVRPSSTQSTKPYRKSYFSTYTEHLTLHDGNPLPCARAMETLTGADRLDVLALKNTEQLMPVATVIEWEGAKYSLPVPEGWWACDGSTINSPGSLLHGLTAPDHRGYVVGGAGGSWAVDTVAGSDSYTIARSNLPNVTLSGTTGGGGEHAHTIPQLSFAANTSTVPATSSTNPFALAASTAWTMDHEVGGDLTGTIRAYPAFATTSATATFSDTNHSHSISGFTSQGITSTISAHTHTLTTSSLNGNVPQTAMDMRQRTRYVTKLIKL